MSKRRRHHEPPEPDAPQLSEQEQKAEEELIAAAVAEAVAPLLEKIAKVDASTAAINLKLSERQRDDALAIVANRHGVIPGAQEDFVRRAAQTFSLVSGQLVAHDDAGIPVFSREQPSLLLDVDEYAKLLREKDAPYLFKQPRKDRR